MSRYRCLKIDLFCLFIDTDTSKEDVCEMIESQTDSCERKINNPIGERLSFYRIEAGHVAKEGEILIHTDGNEQRGGHAFHYG